MALFKNNSVMCNVMCNVMYVAIRDPGHCDNG
jgi:hypothetical protein